MDTLEEIPKKVDILYYRTSILRWFAVTTLISGFTGFLFGIFTNSNYWLFALLIFLTSVIVLILSFLGKHKISIIIQVFICDIAILVQVTQTKSAYLATMLGLVLIITSILSSTRIAWLMFFLNIIVIIIYTILDIFSITQTFHPDTNIASVDNISVLIPMMIISLGIALVISKILINLIEYQKQQYLLLKKTQETLFNQMKLESIQFLAGGIAHDFNNILTAILGNVSLLEDEQEIMEEHKSTLVEIEHATLQAKNLTNKLLTFAKGGTSTQKDIINIEQLIKETADFSLRGKKSKVEFEIEPNIKNIYANADQISQMVQNLLLNADEAMENGGLILVSLKNIYMKEKNEFNLPIGEYIQIRIEDEGKGIPPEAETHVFSPFYTTKATGTGLGLAICESIVQKHNGSITYSSKLQSGTIFNIFLPSTQKEVIKCDDEKNERVIFSGNALVLDDKEIVSKTLSKILQKLGFTVKTFSTGKKLMKSLLDYQRNEKKIEIIFLDLTIPGEKGGIEIAKEIRALNFPTKLVLSSGYSSKNQTMKEMMENLDKYFDGKIDKPYTIKEISTLLQTILFC